MTAPDTRTLSKAWIEENIEKNSTVLAEGAVVDLLIFSPQLNSNIETLKREKEKVISEGGVGRIHDKRIEWSRENPEKICYNIYKTRTMNAILLNKIKPDVVIMTGANDVKGSPSQKDVDEREDVRMILGRDYKLVKLFKACPELSWFFPMISKEDFIKIKNIKFAKNDIIIFSGYDIAIYKREGL